jgi:hypothetical protein
MNYEGNFNTQDGKDYDVAVFEDKNAIELFDKVKKNVALIYRSPKDVESNFNDKIISIYGYAPIVSNLIGGYRRLFFHFIIL